MGQRKLAEQQLASNLAIIYSLLEPGVSGTFTSADSKTVTVTNGIITGIV